MLTLDNLMGGAKYVSFSTNLTVGSAWPRVVILHPTAANLYVFMPDETLPKTTAPRRFYLVNTGSYAVYLLFKSPLAQAITGATFASSDHSISASGGGLDLASPGSIVIITSSSANNGSFTVKQRSPSKLWLTSGITNSSGSATLTRQTFGSLPAGHVATVTLGLGVNGRREWYFTHRATGSGRSFTYARADGSSRVSVYNPDTRPAAAAPPPAFTGTQADLSGCVSTFTATVISGTGDFAVWNGVWTLTKSSTAPYYWRGVIDVNHWIDLRVYPPGDPEDFPWQFQLVFVDLTGKARKRYGANSAGPCPNVGDYVQFVEPSEGALDLSGSPTVTLS